MPLFTFFRKEYLLCFFILAAILSYKFKPCSAHYPFEIAHIKNMFCYDQFSARENIEKAD
jgi:hypothetical protein